MEEIVKELEKKKKSIVSVRDHLKKHLNFSLYPGNSVPKPM